MKKFFALMVAVGTLALTGCATNPMSGTSTGYERVQQAQRAEQAMVVSVRDVVVTTNSPQRAVLGAVVGGLVGHAIGSELGRGGYVGQTLGTTVVGAAGAEVARRSNKSLKGQEISIILKSGNIVTLVQNTADGVVFAKGQLVLFIGGERIAPMN
jgi:outer membrane lipoprotein SlyB